MVNYQQGKIYTIVCHTTGLVYYGSTCEPSLARRLDCHKRSYMCAKYKVKCTSTKVLENDNYGIFLAENYPCNNKDELRMRERFYIENNECVNKCIPIRFKHEKLIILKEQYKKHKKERLENMKTYYAEHKAEIDDYQKEYLKINKAKHHEYCKRWYDKNKVREFFLNFLKCFDV